MPQYFSPIYLLTEEQLFLLIYRFLGQQRKREYDRQDRIKHPDTRKNWRLNDAPHVAQYNHDYGKTNRDTLREKERARNKANPEKVRTKNRNYSRANSDKINKAVKKKRLANLDRYRGYDHKRNGTPARKAAAATAKHQRRAQRQNAAINDLTAAQWREIQEVYDHRCVYCGKRRKGRLTQEHLTPLSKGGDHTAANVVPACKTCNSRKQAGPVLRPVQPLLLTLAPAKKKKESA
jgi:hypothetical protein